MVLPCIFLYHTFTKKARGLSLFVWFSLILLVSRWEFDSAVLKVVFHVYTLEFILGCVSAYLYIGFKDNISNKTFAVAFLLAMVIYLGFYFSPDALPKTSALRALLFGGFFALVIWFLAVLELKQWFKACRPLNFIGDISYSIYLSHIMILSFFGRVWSFISHGQSASDLTSALFWLVSLSGVIAFSYISYFLIEREKLFFALRR